MSNALGAAVCGQNYSLYGTAPSSGRVMHLSGYLGKNRDEWADSIWRRLWYTPETCTISLCGECDVAPLELPSVDIVTAEAATYAGLPRIGNADVHYLTPVKSMSGRTVLIKFSPHGAGWIDESGESRSLFAGQFAPVDMEWLEFADYAEITPGTDGFDLLSPRAWVKYARWLDQVNPGAIDPVSKMHLYNPEFSPRKFASRMCWAAGSGCGQERTFALQVCSWMASMLGRVIGHVILRTGAATVTVQYNIFADLAMPHWLTSNTQVADSLTEMGIHTPPTVGLLRRTAGPRAEVMGAYELALTRG